MIEFNPIKKSIKHKKTSEKSEVNIFRIKNYAFKYLA